MQGILLVDHGSRREASNYQLGDMACRVAGLLPDCEVYFAHMEIAPPSIAEGIDLLVSRGVTELTVMLYFLSDGRHVTRDVPELVAAAAAKYPQLTWHIGQPLGPCDSLAELLLARANYEPRPLPPDAPRRPCPA